MSSHVYSICFCGYRFLPFGEVKAHKVNNQIQEVLDALGLSGVSPNIKDKLFTMSVAGLGEGSGSENVIALILFHLTCQALGNFSGVNSKGLYLSSGKIKENCCLVFTSCIKREIRQCRVVVVQRRHRNVQKKVIHVQSFCFANLNLLVFSRSRGRRLRRG